MDGMDVSDIHPVYLGPLGYTQTIWSSITCYIHPDALQSTSGASQETARQLVLDRVADWLRALCFNTAAASSPTIGSREYSVSPNFDQLTLARIESIEKGLTQKSFAGSQLLPYVFCRHRAEIEGNG